MKKHLAKERLRSEFPSLKWEEKDYHDVDCFIAKTEDSKLMFRSGTGSGNGVLHITTPENTTTIGALVSFEIPSWKQELIKQGELHLNSEATKSLMKILKSL